MKPAISLSISFAAIIIVSLLATAEFAVASTVEEVATNGRQWTGVAVSKSGRIFVNFPRGSADVPVSVAELGDDGEAKPYPNVEMNSWKTGDDPAGKFVCIQSVYVDANNRLWILDPGFPDDDGVIPGAARLFEVDLSSDEIVCTIQFDDTSAPKWSYLNDVRVDTATDTAFITDSELGAIVVVDLETGSARRVLESHSSTKAEKIKVVMSGIPFEYPVQSDGIALDATGGWLYYQALTGRTLYRVPTSALRDPSLTDDALAELVERYAESAVSDGLLFTPEGIYVSALEDDSIKLVGNDRKLTTVVTDPLISWPDSFARGPDGAIVFTTSQIHLDPNPPEPYRILRISDK
jgi:sugar lactone lactonase YvrE